MTCWNQDKHPPYEHTLYDIYLYNLTNVFDIVKLLKCNTFSGVLPIFVLQFGSLP